MQNHHQKRWSANNMYITRNRIQKLDCRTTWEINFSGPFSLWKRVRTWSCVSQNFQHLLWRSLCRSCSYSADVKSAILQSTTTCRSLECSLTENPSIVAMWSSASSLDHLSVTESWLTSNGSITTVDLTNSLEDYAVYHLPRSTRRGGGLPVIARKGLHVSRNKGCILSSFKHFDLTITSGDKVNRLVTGYRPQPSKKKMALQQTGFSQNSLPS